MSDPLQEKYNKIMLMLFHSLEEPLLQSQIVIERINQRLGVHDTPLGDIKPATSEKGRAFFKSLAELERIGNELTIIEEVLFNPETLRKAGGGDGTTYQTLRAENELDSLLDDITLQQGSPSGGPPGVVSPGAPTRQGITGFFGNRVLKPNEAPATVVDYTKPIPDILPSADYMTYDDEPPARKIEKGDSSFNITLAPLSVNPSPVVPDMPPELRREQELIAQGKFKPTPVVASTSSPAVTPTTTSAVDDDPSDPAPAKPTPLSFAGMPMNAEQEVEFKEYQIAKYEYETWENRQIVKKKKAAGLL